MKEADLLKNIQEGMTEEEIQQTVQQTYLHYQRGALMKRDKMLAIATQIFKKEKDEKDAKEKIININLQVQEETNNNTTLETPKKEKNKEETTKGQDTHATSELKRGTIRAEEPKPTTDTTTTNDKVKNKERVNPSSTETQEEERNLEKKVDKKYNPKPGEQLPDPTTQSPTNSEDVGREK